MSLQFPAQFTPFHGKEQRFEYLQNVQEAAGGHAQIMDGLFGKFLAAGLETTLIAFPAITRTFLLRIFSLIHLQPITGFHPIRDLLHRHWDVVIRDIQLQPGQHRLAHHALHQFLLAHENRQVVVLVGFAGDLGPFLARGCKRFGSTVQEHQAEVERQQARLQPVEVEIPAVGLQLVERRREVGIRPGRNGSTYKKTRLPSLPRNCNGDPSRTLIVL